MDHLIKKLEILWGIPIFRKERGTRIESFGTFPDNENPLANSEKLLNVLTARADGQDVPVIYKDSHKVYFMCVKKGNIYYLSGPVCAETLSYVEIHRYYKEYRITTDQERHPVRRSLSKLLNFVSFFYELLEGVSVDVDTLMLKNNLVQAQGEKTEKDKVMLEMEKIDEDIYHHTYNEERYMMECIREGRPDEGVERMVALIENTGHFSRNELMNHKYLAVIFITMATREAIAGGAPPAEAYRTSDILINQADQCKNIDEIVELMRRVYYAFSDLVTESRKNRDANSYTEQCKDYIMQNYHHKIYLDEMSEAIGVSRGHLSRVFRRDTGMQIQEYIQKTRVERAANLLKYSEASLTEISDYVCFNSQSHFGSVFKKYMNMTPGEYRNRYKQKEFRSN